MYLKKEKIQNLKAILENITGLLDWYEVGTGDYDRIKSMYFVFAGMLYANEEYEKSVTIKEKVKECKHDFFKCQVPSSDSCKAIYHEVCRKCRWDETKGIIMPEDIWNGWAIPQLKKESKKCQ